MSIREAVERVDFRGQSLVSINDMSNEQVMALFDLAEMLESFIGQDIRLMGGKMLGAIFFEPSTRTRLSFETAMYRLGGSTISESTPLISSSSAKEESLSDMLQVVGDYVDLIVLRHFDADQATEAVSKVSTPVISGGFGGREHPTQALLDLYTVRRLTGKVEGVKVVIASADLNEARTGHSLAYGLGRFGAEVVLASPSDYRTPGHIRDELKSLGANFSEELDLTQDSFNELIADSDIVYLPGCRLPKGPEAEAFKAIMDNYFVRPETLAAGRKNGGQEIYLMHCLPRRAGEVDLSIDETASGVYFQQSANGVPVRMALICSVLGVS